MRKVAPRAKPSHDKCRSSLLFDAKPLALNGSSSFDDEAAMNGQWFSFDGRASWFRSAYRKRMFQERLEDTVHRGRGQILPRHLQSRRNQTRPAETETCAHRFVDLFSTSAKFYAEDDVAAGGIKTALAEWGRLESTNLESEGSGSLTKPNGSNSSCEMVSLHGSSCAGKTLGWSAGEVRQTASLAPWKN
jgi:hypothetical protein